MDSPFSVVSCFRRSAARVRHHALKLLPSSRSHDSRCRRSSQKRLRHHTRNIPRIQTLRPCRRRRHATGPSSTSGPTSTYASAPADGLHVGEIHPHQLPPVLRVKAAEWLAGPVPAAPTVYTQEPLRTVLSKCSRWCSRCVVQAGELHSCMWC